jgi:uncharacterized membrane protein
MSETASDGHGTAEIRRTRAGTRVWVAMTAGLAAFGIAILLTPWQVAITLAWIVSAGVFLVWIWTNIHGADAERTAALATGEDPSRFGADLLLTAASGASLVAVALALLQASSERGVEKDLIIAAAGLCLVVSWTTVNTVFTLRYARLYYQGAPGGIEFGGRPAPTYADFAYLAFTIGMTYQVSDTQLSSPAMRTTVLRHALLSFVFVTSVVAMTINIVAQLFT